jgi:hypothetical protein
VEILLGVVGAAVVLAVALVAIAIVVGRGLPVAHVATRDATFSASPDRIWAAIEDPATLRARGVGDVKLETVESDRPRRLVRRIVGETAFGGTWTCELAPSPGGTTVRITENGEVYNAFFRFVSRYILGHHRTIDGYLKALRAEVEAASA